MKSRRFNPLALLSLPALIAPLALWTGNHCLWCFACFLCFLRYLWVEPDELFLLNARRAAAWALTAELAGLAPLMYGCYLVLRDGRAVAAAFSLSFGAAVAVFAVSLTVLEFREAKAADD